MPSVSWKVPGAPRAIHCAANVPVVNALLQRVRFYSGQKEHYRTKNYAAAAQLVAGLSTPLEVGATLGLPGIGKSIARTIDEALREAAASERGQDPAAAVAAESASQRTRTVRRKVSATRLAQQAAKEAERAADGRRVHDVIKTSAAESAEDVAVQPMLDVALRAALEQSLPSSSADMQKDEVVRLGRAMVPYDEAMQYHQLIQRAAQQISKATIVEPVGATRRHAMVTRRLHLLVTATGSSSDTIQDEEYQITLRRVVRACQHEGFIGGDAQREGARGFIVRGTLDQQAMEAARQQRRRAMVPPVVEADVTAAAAVRRDEKEEEPFLQRIHLEWSAHDRFFARLVCLTGTTEYVEMLQEAAAAQGMRLTAEEGLTVASKTHIHQTHLAVVPCASEADVFRLIGVPYLEPVFRTRLLPIVSYSQF
jgi:DNA polymerase/3'-5' exonuclease PolX